MRVLANSTKKKILKRLCSFRYANSQRTFGNAVYNELFRLLKLPHIGKFSWLHHEQQTEETETLRERLSYIIWAKPKDELLSRLKHIHYLKNSARANFLSCQIVSWHCSDRCKDEHKNVWKEIDAA